MIVLDTEQSKERKKAIDELLELKAQELHHKEAEYTETMNSSRLKLYGLQSRAKFAEDIRDKYKSLSEMGVLAELQYLEAEERFDNLKNEVTKSN